MATLVPSVQTRNPSIISNELPDFRDSLKLDNLNNRRRSTLHRTGLFKRAGGAKLLEEFGSQRGVGLEIFENTYKLEPDPGTKFSVRRTEELVHNIMNTELANYKYSDETAGEKITCLTKNIMEELKTLGFVRYKMVVHAIVTRQGMRRPGLSHASRGIWNTAFDNWAAVTFDSPRVAAVVTVYGVYFE